jgi:hypothetical protein
MGSGAANAATAGADAATIGSTAADLGTTAATQALTTAPTALGAGAAGLGADAASIGSTVGSNMGLGAGTSAIPSIASPFADIGASTVANTAAPSNMLGNMFGPTAGRFGEGFSQAAGQNLMGTASTPSMMRTGIAALGAGMPVLEAMQPTYKPYQAPDESSNYQGPYRPTERIARFRGPTPTSDSSEHLYFEDVNPYPGYETAAGGTPTFTPLGMAAGGSTFAPSARGASYGAGQGAAPPINFEALRAMMQQQPRPIAAPPAVAPAVAPPMVGGEKVHNFGAPVLSPLLVLAGLAGLMGLAGLAQLTGLGFLVGTSVLAVICLLGALLNTPLLTTS